MSAASTLTWIAAAASALFTGGALYATLVEHPARMACGPPMALAQFRMSYPRGARLQAPLAIVACLGGAGAWLSGAPPAWLGAGVMVGLVVPFTLAGMRPTIGRLRDPALGPDSPETHHLLGRWGRLHLVRTILGVIASLWMLRLLAAG